MPAFKILHKSLRNIMRLRKTKHVIIRNREHMERLIRLHNRFNASDDAKILAIRRVTHYVGRHGDLIPRRRPLYARQLFYLVRYYFVSEEKMISFIQAHPEELPESVTFIKDVGQGTYVSCVGIERLDGNGYIVQHTPYLVCSIPNRHDIIRKYVGFSPRPRFIVVIESRASGLPFQRSMEGSFKKWLELGADLVGDEMPWWCGVAIFSTGFTSTSTQTFFSWCCGAAGPRVPVLLFSDGDTEGLDGILNLIRSKWAAPHVYHAKYQGEAVTIQTEAAREAYEEATGEPFPGVRPIADEMETARNKLRRWILTVDPSLRALALTAVIIDDLGNFYNLNACRDLVKRIIQAQVENLDEDQLEIEQKDVWLDLMSGIGYMEEKEGVDWVLRTDGQGNRYRDKGRMKRRDEVRRDEMDRTRRRLGAARHRA